MLATARAIARHHPGSPIRSGARWRLVNVLLLAAIVAAGLVAYFVAGTKTTAQTRVTTGTVQRGSVHSTVSASGNVTARSVSVFKPGANGCTGQRRR